MVRTHPKKREASRVGITPHGLSAWAKSLKRDAHAVRLDQTILPTLVIAKKIIVDVFREECSAADGHPRQSGWRSDRAHPEPFLAAA